MHIYHLISVTMKNHPDCCFKDYALTVEDTLRELHLKSHVLLVKKPPGNCT